MGFDTAACNEDDDEDEDDGEGDDDEDDDEDEDEEGADGRAAGTASEVAASIGPSLITQQRRKDSSRTCTERRGAATENEVATLMNRRVIPALSPPWPWIWRTRTPSSSRSCASIDPS